MAQITTGIRSILSKPVVYDALQRIMGSDRLRKRFVEQYVEPYKVSNILDIGCGSAEILAYLPEVEYFGFDISDPYIQEATGKYGKKGKFFSKFLSFDDLDYLPRFDMVLLLGVLHHLDDASAINLLNIAHTALKPGGRLLTIDGCLVDGQNPIARKLILMDRGQNIRNEAGYHQLVSQVFEHVNISIKHEAWIPYTHLYMECTRP